MVSERKSADESDAGLIVATMSAVPTVPLVSARVPPISAVSCTVPAPSVPLPIASRIAFTSPAVVFVGVEFEPTRKYPEIVPLPVTSRVCVGPERPIPTFPPFVTTKFVAVEEPIAKEGPEMPFGFTESWAHGDVVPTPTFPFVLMNKDDVPIKEFVPLKYATWPRVPV